jgi:ABC-type lipoprotein export system ATPase subunit
VVAIARARAGDPPLILTGAQMANDWRNGEKVIRFLRPSALVNRWCMDLVTPDLRTELHFKWVLRLEDGRLLT